MVRENKLRKKLTNGYLAFGAVTQIPSTALVEILGLSGFDFAMIDTEHGMYDIQTAGELIRAANGSGLDALVRVIGNDKGVIMKALDMGAQGVIVPHISNKDDAAQAVESCRYGSATGRGACPVVRAADYGLGHWPTIQKESDMNAMAIMLIEDLEGVRNIDDIISVDGVDAVYLGPFDMSVSAGYKGEWNNPEIQKALDTVLTACNERNVPVMHSLLFGTDVEMWAEKGVRLFLQRADASVFSNACKTFLESVEYIKTKKFAGSYQT